VNESIWNDDRYTLLLDNFYSSSTGECK
jgi:hypothetical protein